MRNLIAFLVKNGAWFLFIFLELVCAFLIFQYNTYQHSIYLNSSNEIVGRVYSISGKVNTFFAAQKDVEHLFEQNAELQRKVWMLESTIKSMQSDSVRVNAFTGDSVKYSDYDFIIGRVINNSITKADNYLTINKGKKDGLKKEMGVISEDGIVGIVREVSENFACVQSVLNSKSFVSCKSRSTNAQGTLIWHGGDSRYAYMQGYPRHEGWKNNDVIVTSGFSSIFPEGIVVGKVVNAFRENDDNFITLQVELTTDFSSISNVIVFDDKKAQEKKNLEELVTQPLKKKNAK